MLHPRAPLCCPVLCPCVSTCLSPSALLRQLVVTCISTAARAVWATKNEDELSYACLGPDRNANCSNSADYAGALYLFTFLIL